MCLSCAFFFSRGGPSSRRQTSASDRDPEDSSRRHSNRDNFPSWRERQYLGPRRWLESALRDSSWDKDPGINFYNYLSKCF